MTLEEILVAVAKDRDTQEQYYIDNGPRKHEQEEFVGPQVVSMNMRMLSGWLNDRDMQESFDSLSKDQRRKIWEASDFHYGIMGYEQHDADFYWEHEER